MAKAKGKKTIGDAFLHQISVLKTLSRDGVPTALRSVQLSEITERSGLGDEKEVLRYLYILEGQKLVSPQPEGDFTSRTWAITTDGVRALKTISMSTIQ